MRVLGPSSVAAGRNSWSQPEARSAREDLLHASPAYAGMKPRNDRIMAAPSQQLSPANRSDKPGGGVRLPYDDASPSRGFSIETVASIPRLVISDAILSLMESPALCELFSRSRRAHPEASSASARSGGWCVPAFQRARDPRAWRRP